MSVMISLSFPREAIKPSATCFSFLLVKLCFNNSLKNFISTYVHAENPKKTQKNQEKNFSLPGFQEFKERDLTVCVTSRWAGRDESNLTENVRTQDQLLLARRIPPVEFVAGLQFNFIQSFLDFLSNAHK